MMNRPWLAVATAAALLAAPDLAGACGCFAPPSPATPVLQAGERILFAIERDEIVMHVQIQYAGDGKDFGWILPLPAVPKVELGTDELFLQLVAKTSPRFLLNQTFDSCSSPISFGCGFGDSASPSMAEASPDLQFSKGPLVVAANVGPYDYAVLKADNKKAMFDWLAANRYFVPAGTMEAVDPYIHPGAYFLALKLRTGATAGDVQPVVLRYPGTLPMIPLVLTAVGAVPDMGIAVYLLGTARAIPRNYHHVVIDDAAIDWQSRASNYGAVVNRALDEAPEHHAFVTEYAGPSDVMSNTLARPGRFGTAAQFVATTDAAAYGSLLVASGFTFTGALVATLAELGIPMPPQLVLMNVPPAAYYANIEFYRTTYPGFFKGLEFKYDPKLLTDAIWKRVVLPTQAAQKLFTDHRYLTFLYSTLSPAEMTADPVFSFNPDLPAVATLHTATMHSACDGNAELRLESGLKMPYLNGAPKRPLTGLPGSLRIERLRETGAPELVTDNRALIQVAAAPGCAVNRMASRPFGFAALFALLLLTAGRRLLRRRRRAAS